MFFNKFVKSGTILICFFILLDFSNLYCKKILKIGWESWKPYQYEDEKGNLTGLDIELLKLIVSKTDYELDFRKIPWIRQLKDLEKGKLDLASGASKTKEREKFAYFTDSYRTESVKLYVLKDESDKYDFKELKDIFYTNFVLGVSKGYYYGETVNRYLKNNSGIKKRIQEVANDTYNYRKLLKGRIDGFFADPVSFSAIIRKNNLQNKIKEHSLDVYSSEIFIMLSHNTMSKKIADELNHALKTVKLNGEYQKILKRYLVIE